MNGIDEHVLIHRDTFQIFQSTVHGIPVFENDDVFLWNRAISVRPKFYMVKDPFGICYFIMQIASSFMDSDNNRFLGQGLDWFMSFFKSCFGATGWTSPFPFIHRDMSSFKPACFSPDIFFCHSLEELLRLFEFHSPAPLFDGFLRPV